MLICFCHITFRVYNVPKNFSLVSYEPKVQMFFLDDAVFITANTANLHKF